MDLSSYSESFKFWLQFFCQKSQLATSMQDAANSELLANFWTLFQLQQQYSATTMGLAPKQQLDELSMSMPMQMQMPMPMPNQHPHQSPVNLLGQFAQRCNRKLHEAKSPSLELIDVESHKLQHPHPHQHQHPHHRAKKTPKRMSSVSMSACNSSHSPASSTMVSTSPRPNGCFSSQPTSGSQPQPIIKMDLSKEEIAEINSELSKIENRIGPYKCMLCLFTFDDAIQLACHSCPNIVNVEYRCPECSKVFNCPANLASHRRWHKRRQTNSSTPGAINAALPTFAGTLSSPATSLPTYDLFELPAKRVCSAASFTPTQSIIGPKSTGEQDQSKEDCKSDGSGPGSGSGNGNGNGKKPARFSVEFLLGCKLLDQDAFGKPTSRNPEIETS